MTLHPISAAAFMSFALISQAQAINKCTGTDGKVVLQDAPCSTEKAEVLHVRPASGKTPTTDEAQARAQKNRSDNDMAAAIREKRPAVGMTTRQLQEAMGQATTVNTDTSAGGTREQAVYERDNEVWYVYVRAGRVEHVQHRPLPPMPNHHTTHGQRNEWKAANGRCPLSNEIREAQMAADSLTNTPDQQATLRRKLKEMRDCK